MKCYICGDDATPRYHRKNMCSKHQRFMQMQSVAKNDGKYCPSIYEIEKLVPKDMVCGDCGDAMNWISADNRSKGAVLQHYRDGTLGIVCLSCNTKHGLMPGDSYCEIPNDHKLCKGCKAVKPRSMFGLRKDSGVPYPKTKCKACNLDDQRKWRLKNPEKYKELNKKHNEAKKLNPEKYRELDRKYYHERKKEDAAQSIHI